MTNYSQRYDSGYRDRQRVSFRSGGSPSQHRPGPVYVSWRTDRADTRQHLRSERTEARRDIAGAGHKEAGPSPFRRPGSPQAANKKLGEPSSKA